jgi:hypothetical protein
MQLSRYRDQYFCKYRKIILNKTKTAGIILLICGSILFIVSLSADYIGVGDLDPDHFTLGYKQITGIVVGAVGILFGIFLWRKNC